MIPCMCVYIATVARKSIRVGAHVYALDVYATVNEVDAVDKVDMTKSTSARVYSECTLARLESNTRRVDDDAPLYSSRVCIDRWCR